MRPFIDAVRQAVTQQNWYAALVGALTLPDIAARLDGRPGRSGPRYASWFNDYLRSAYTSTNPFDPAPHVFLSGGDCYALRCAFLHQGDFDIAGQHAREVLDRFHFWAPDPGLGVRVHCNQHGSTLQLQVSCFCEDVCCAVEAWILARGADPAVAAAIAAMPRIQLPGESSPYVGG